MLLKFLNGDTINGLKLRREGVLSLLYLERLKEIPQWVNNFKLALIKVPVLTGLTIGLTKKKKE